MSYHMAYKKFEVGDEDYKSIDDDRKQQILQELQDEMDKLKVKYMLNEKDKAATEKISQIKSLDTMTNRENMEMNIQEIYDYDQKEPEELEPVEENYETYNYQSQLEETSREPLQMSHRSNTNYNRQSNNTSNYEMFDKAKENLLRIKNELDDLDQYDYRHRPYNPSVYINKDKENVLEDYLVEEEQPKNFEQEVSMTMSMSKSIRENSDFFGGSQNYKFNTPYVAHLTNPRHEIPINIKNNPIPRGRAEISKSNSKIKLMSNERSSSDSQGKRNNAYFKKIMKEYNPKYKHEKSKSKEKFLKIKQEVQEKFDKEHTFKPNINYSNVFSNVEKNYESKDELYKRLSTPKIVELNKRLKEKELNDEQRLADECSFKPNIKPSTITVDPAREKVENRLYKLAEQMKEKREKLKREHQESLTKDLSFTPNIDLNSKQLMLKYESHRPIHVRYNDVVKSKKENLQYMRETLEKEEKSLYKPEINPKSKDILKKLDRSFTQDFPIHERLYREGITKAKNKKTSNEVEDEECTFTPQICYSTTQPGGNIDDFLERQKIYDEIKKERLERKLSKSIEYNQYTFQPKINLTSDILMRADHNRANEDIKEKVDRMYKDNFDKMKSRKEQLEKFYYAQFDFKPKINEISRFVGRDHTIEDLYNKQESEKVKRLKEQINNHQDGCTFKPVINKKEKYENVQSNYKPDENILQRIQSEVRYKSEKVEEIKNLIEQKNMKECKFHPEIKKEMPNYESKEPIIIKGFAKHLDQMEKARKAKREKEEREKEVFITGENWSKDNLITIPKPFNLSYKNSNLKSKKDEMHRKNIQMEMKECTFKPTTNES